MTNMMTKKILLLGDIMIDKWLYGSVHRMSPENPVVPILLEGENNKYNLGGAGNVYLSLKNIEGYEVDFITVSGVSKDIQNIPYEDVSKIKFIGNVDGITTKTRYICTETGEHLLRTDKDIILDESEVNPYLIPLVESSLGDFSLCVISDYGKGNITYKLMSRIRRSCKFVVDPKHEDWNLYMGAYAITPNFKEFMEAVHHTFEVWTNIENRKEFFPSIIEYAKKLMKFYDFEELVLKLSENGIIYFWNGGVDHLHGYSLVENLVDVTGAGDCVLASYIKNIDEDSKVVVLNRMLRAAKKCCESPGTYVLQGNE